VPVISRKLPTEAVVLPTWPLQPRLLTIPQAAAYLACSVWSVRNLIRQKRLTKIRIGRKYLLDISDLNAFIERERKEG
jgi:excisionase family DNA binding protein